MDLPFVLRGETLDLFDDADFRAVLAIEKRRNHSEAQVRPALQPLGPALTQPPLDRTSNETEFPGATINWN